MVYTQDQINQLVREAAAQAGGTLSYTDASNAARNMGIPDDLLRGALSTGLITGAPTQANNGIPAGALPAVNSSNNGIPAGALPAVNSSNNGILAGALPAVNSSNNGIPAAGALPQATRAVTTAAQPAYFVANPDVAAAYQQNSYGMTPEQFAATHYQKFGASEQRAAPTGALAQATAVAPAPTAAPTAAPAASSTWTAPALQAVQEFGGEEGGGAFNPNDGKYYSSRAEADAANAAIVTDSKKTALANAWQEAQTSNNYTKLAGILTNTSTTGYDLQTMFGLTPAQQAEVATKTGVNLTPKVITDHRGKTYDTAAVLNLANQLAGVADTSAFSGGVFGVQKGSVGFDYDQAARALGRDLSAGEQVLLDSARSLIDQGITDLSKLGIGDIKTSVNVRQEFDEEGRPTGQYYATIPTGNIDSEGNTEYTNRALTPEEAARIRTEEITGVGEDSGSYTRRLLDDMVTGRGVVYDGKGKVTGNVLDAGVTYTGKGGTTYQITYDDQGKPRFTTTGFSTSDLGTIAPLLQIASFIPGVAPFAMAANAAIAASQGNVFGALASLAGMGGYTNLATGLNVANAVNNKDIGGVVGALLSNPSIAGAAGTTMLTDTISLADLGNAANLAVNIDNGNWVGALNSVGSLMNNSDVRVAASALTIATELGKDNPNFSAILNAAQTINNVTASASNNVNAETITGITNRVVDDLSISGGNDLGSSTYVAAINAGATDEEALAAANAVTGVSTTNTATSGNNGVTVNAIDAGGPNTSVTTTATTGTRDTEWGDLQGAIDTNTTRTNALNTISALPKFNDAFAQARTLLGPNQTFTWNGKQYSTATAAERPDLNITSADRAIDALNATNLATTTDASNTIAAQTDNLARIYGSAENQSVAETNRLRNLNAGLDLAKANQRADETRTAINSVLGEGTASNIVLQGLSNLNQAIGQTFDFIGGAGASLGLAGSDNTLTNLGQSVTRTGEALQLQSVNQANQNVIQAVNDADGLGNKVWAGAKAVIENPLSANMAAIELIQEGMPLALAAKIYSVAGKFAAIGADVALNSIESGGAARNEAYREAIAGGATEQEAESKADTKFWIASTITALTGAAVDTAVVNKVTKALENVATKSATTGVREGGTEVVEVLATEVLSELATGGPLTASKIDDIFTKAAVEGLVGGKTSTAADTTSSAGSVVTGIADTGAATTTGTTAGTGLGTLGTERPGAGTITSTDLGPIGDVTPGGDTTAEDTGAADISGNVTTQINSGADTDEVINSIVSSAITAGTGADVVIGSTVSSAINAGADADVVIGSTVSSAINAGADVSIVLDSAITSAVNSGANVDIAMSTAISSAVNAGANVNAVVAAVTNAATNTGNDVTVTSNAATVTVTNATTGTNTTINTVTGVTTSVNNTTGVTTTTQMNADTGIATTTVVNATTGTTVQVEVDRNTDTVVSVDAEGLDTTVIDSDTIDLGDGVVIDISTGETLTPAEVQRRKGRAKLSLPKRQESPGAIINAPAATPPYNPSNISETWLGGQFRNAAPFMALAGLLPENNPMFQEQQSLSALRRASGLDDKVAKPDTDYFSYGSEPSAAAVLAPYKRGGGVQDPTSNGKIMVSPLQAASGGDVEHKGSHYVQGAGGGQDDLIPAKLADGEYVFDAEIVAALGDGSNKEGARKLDEFREAIRSHKRSGSIKTIPPKAKSPLAYMKGIK